MGTSGVVGRAALVELVFVLELGQLRPLRFLVVVFLLLPFLLDLRQLQVFDAVAKRRGAVPLSFSL